MTRPPLTPTPLQPPRPSTLPPHAYWPERARLIHHLQAAQARVNNAHQAALTADSCNDTRAASRARIARDHWDDELKRFRLQLARLGTPPAGGTVALVPSDAARAVETTEATPGAACPLILEKHYG